MIFPYHYSLYLTTRKRYCARAVVIVLDPRMGRLFYFLTILSLFGSCCSVSKRAFRDLSRKVDLIRTSLQQDIGDLKIEVLDLRSQLESERNRADRLEELLNGTGALPDIGMFPVFTRYMYINIY